MACRQTYSEGIGLYYHNNVLCINNLSDMAASTTHLPTKLIANNSHILLTSAKKFALAKHPQYAYPLLHLVARRAQWDLEMLHRLLGLSDAEDALIRKVRYEIVRPGRERVFTATPLETAAEIERNWHGEYCEPQMLQQKSIAKYKPDKEAIRLARIDGEEQSVIGPWKILELEEKTPTDESTT